MHFFLITTSSFIVISLTSFLMKSSSFLRKSCFAITLSSPSSLNCSFVGVKISFGNKKKFELILSIQLMKIYFWNWEKRRFLQSISSSSNFFFCLLHSLYFNLTFAYYSQETDNDKWNKRDDKCDPDDSEIMKMWVI